MILTVTSALNHICPVMSYRTMEATKGPEKVSWLKHCTGSVCMAWRWAEETPYDLSPKSIIDVREKGCDECELPYDAEAMIKGMKWAMNNECYTCPRCGHRQSIVTYRYKDRRGYCGLAGKPTEV